MSGPPINLIKTKGGYKDFKKLSFLYLFEYFPKEGWSYTENYPSNYTNYDDGQVFENYREVENEALKCDKPREVPKCCKEPPYCV